MSRKIDALIAEHVFGDKYEPFNGDYYRQEPDWVVDQDFVNSFSPMDPHRPYVGDILPGNLVPCPSYSTDIATAWLITTEIDKASAVSEFRLNQDYEGLWSCRLSWANEGESCKGEAFNVSTAPIAICLAALKAKGVKYE